MNAELLKQLIAAGVPAAEAVKLATATAAGAPAAEAPRENANGTSKFSQGSLTITVPAAEIAKATVRTDKSGKLFRYVRIAELGIGFPLYTRNIPGAEAPSK